MIINFFGIQLQIIDNGDGTFDVKPLDAVLDKQVIRDELADLRSQKADVNIEIDAATKERDYHVAGRDRFIQERTDKVAERDSLNTRIAELVSFLQSAGDVTP